MRAELMTFRDLCGIMADQPTLLESQNAVCYTIDAQVYRVQRHLDASATAARSNQQFCFRVKQQVDYCTGRDAPSDL